MSLFNPLFWVLALVDWNIKLNRYIYYRIESLIDRKHLRYDPSMIPVSVLKIIEEYNHRNKELVDFLIETYHRQYNENRSDLDIKIINHIDQLPIDAWIYKRFSGDGTVDVIVYQNKDGFYILKSQARMRRVK